MGLKFGRAKIGIFKKMCIQNLRGGGDQWGPIWKNLTPSPKKRRNIVNDTIVNDYKIII